MQVRFLLGPQKSAENYFRTLLFYIITSFLEYLNCFQISILKMQMRLQHIDPLPLLKGYINKLWIFESDGQVPNEDMKLIVPNGLIKLVIPFRNGLSGKMSGWQHLSKEHSITLIGMCD